MSREEADAGFFRRSLYRVHFLAASLFGGALFVTLSLLALFRLFVLKWERDRAVRPWLDRWSGIMTAAVGWTVRVENPERLTASRPAVIVGNHQSNLDAVVWAKFFPDATVVIGKKQIGLIPVFGALFRATGNILIDRDDPAKARASIADAVARIRREKLQVWMAPEGHRNPKREMLPFKRGAFRLAIEAQVPIVPFVVGPLSDVLDAKRFILRPGTIDVKVLEPIPTAGLGDGDVDALSERTRAALDAVRQRLFAPDE